MDNKAIKELKSDKLKAKSCNDVKELIKICNCLGRKYLQSQRYNEAIDEHRQELELSLGIQCRLSEAIARRALGECYSEINEYKKALSEHKKYLSLSESLCDDIEIQRAFATIGRTYLLHAQEVFNTHNKINKKVLIEAKNSFSKALKLCEDLTQLKDKELAEMRSRLYLNLGLVFEIMGLFCQSMTHLNLSMALNKRFGLTEDLFRSQLSLASVYEKNNELEKASNAYDEAIKTATTLKNKMHSLDALFGKGLVLMRLQKVEESRKLFKKAFKLNSPIVEDHQKAIRFLKISSIICDDFRQLSKTNSLEKKMSLCDKMGDHFVELKLFENAIHFYKQELNFGIQCNKSDSEIAKIYVSIGQTFADNLQFEEAIDYFNHELNANRGNGVEESKSLIKIAEMKEYLEKEELNSDIIDAYEMAVEKIGTNDKPFLTDILQRYLAFLQSRRLNNEKVLELKDKLKALCLQKTTECERVEDEDEPDFYDSYDLNDISDLSSDSEEEEVNSGFRPKRMGKTIKRNQLGETPLHRACIEGKVKQVERLLADKHPVNVRDNCGWTPLHEAVNNGHQSIVELLLQSGANIDDNEGANCDGITPLHDACSNGHFAIIRILLRNGSKVTILNNCNETALDSLRDWKKRCSQENSLNDNDLQEYEILEKELQELLKKAGFVRKTIPLIASKRRPKAYLPLIRNRESSPDNSDDSLSVSVNRNRNSRTISSSLKTGSNNKGLDLDNPGVARREYCSSISNLRRNKDPNNDMFEERATVRSKSNPIPALLDERNVVNSDNWLINDCNDTRKRSCLDAYDALNKRSKTSDSNDSHKTRRPKQPSTQRRTRTESSDNASEILSSDNESTSDIESFESIVKNKEKTSEIIAKPFQSNNGFRSHLKPIQVRVCVKDSENTLLVVPILDITSNCLWLNKEVEKRYFAKFGVKPVLSLQTTDGALLSDEDCILDVITGDELKVNAKIESWILEALHQRYKQICDSNAIKPMDDIISELEMTQINGCLKLSDINIPPEQIKPIFKALQRQNNLREIDISCSNIVFDGADSCLDCLPSLPSLQVLNLKCTAIGLQTIEQLSTKSCHNLVELNLSFNSFGDYFCDVISNLIENFPKLNVIDLSACGLTNKVLESNHLNESIKNFNLHSIVLDYNTIDSQLIEKFRKL